MNSHSTETGYKSPLSKGNFARSAEFLKEMKTYLTELKTKSGIPLPKTKRSTFVIGLLFAIRNIESIVEEFILAKDSILQ